MQRCFIVVILAMASYLGCTHSPINDAPIDNKPHISFSNQVLPIIESSCGVSTCHDLKTHQSGLVLSNFSTIRSLVSPRKLFSSILYERVCTEDTSIRMPKVPELALTPLQRDLIKQWIEQGADSIDGQSDVIDTVNISYKNTIAPIFEIHCRGCHNVYDHAGHFDATNINHLRAYGSDGTLVGVITHNSNYQAMPRNADTLGPMLRAGDIAKIVAWTNRGMQNN